MSAIYGVRYTCDRCRGTTIIWHEDGKVPSIRHDLPPGWTRGQWAQAGTPATPQRPAVCPACVPALEEWEAGIAAWLARDGARARAAYGVAQDALTEARKLDPRPSMTVPWETHAEGTAAGDGPDHPDRSSRG